MCSLALIGRASSYNFRMKHLSIVLAALAIASTVFAQPSKPVTIPITLDHNRIIIDVYLPLPDGSSKRVRAWVNSASPEMMMSQRVAALFGSATCQEQRCPATPPREMLIGDLKISLSAIQAAHIPGGVPNDVMVPGMGAEITLPSTVLRSFDVVVDYANREFTIGEPGSIAFKGLPTKVQVSPRGVIQIAAQIEGQSYELALDTGSGITLVASEMISKWHAAHPVWPSLKGAVGVANMLGTADEPDRQLLRIPSLQVGKSNLQNVLVGDLAPPLLQQFRQQTGVDTVGLTGGDALRNYRLGLDYAHAAVYLEPVSHSVAPDIDVVPLTLHPEPDGRYTILAVPEFEGKSGVPEVKKGDVLLGVDGAPATGATLGQVWSLLGGAPGQVRSLTLERDGKRFTADAVVRRLLASATKVPIKSPRRNSNKRH
jgi:hypothetical protein